MAVKQKQKQKSKLSGFEDGSAEQRALYDYMRGKEMSLPEAMMFSLVSSLIGAAQERLPYGSIASEWDDSPSGAMSSIKRRQMYVQSRKLVQKDGMVFSVMRKFTVSVCGGGVKLYVRNTNGERAGLTRKATLGELWLEERIRNVLGDFNKLARLIVAQTFINGDLYALHLPAGSPGGSHPQLRVVLPDLIDKEKYADGWSLTPSPLAYHARPSNAWYDAQEVTAFHVNEELHDGKHGISIPYFLLAELPRYLDWLQQRSLKARSDNLAFVIRYLKNATSLKKRELPSKPMQIDAQMDAEKWDTLTLNSGSSRDATSGDGYEFRMRVAASLGLPEHLVTANAQYAAQMGKDGFPVALFEYYQDSFTDRLIRMAARTLGCKESDLGLAWPQVDLRDRSARMNEVLQLNKERIISRAEVRRQLGYDSALNDKELAEETQQDMMVAPQPPAAGGDFGSLASLGSLGSGGGGLPAPPPPSNMPAGASVTLPSGLPLGGAVPPDSFAGRLMQVGGKSKIGLDTSCITDKLPDLKIVGAGADYGYALGGALILGGLTESGDISIVGEATMMRVDNEGWGKVLDGMRAKYPDLKYIYTGSDEPALTDYLKTKGYISVGKHIGADRTRILIESYLKDHRIEIYYKCRELLSDLFGPQLDQATGMHLTGGRPDHSDAFRYLVVGLLEKIGFIEDIGNSDKPNK